MEHWSRTFPISLQSRPTERLPADLESKRVGQSDNSAEMGSMASGCCRVFPHSGHVRRLLVQSLDQSQMAECRHEAMLAMAAEGADIQLQCLPVGEDEVRPISFVDRARKFELFGQDRDADVIVD